MKKINLIVIFCLAALLCGCGSTPEIEETPQNMDPLAEWWNNPGAVTEHLAAVGTTVFMGNLSQARNSAAADGRAQLAAALKTKIQQLVEDWAKSAGDLKIQNSLSSYINNETFTRQFVETHIIGARPIKFKHDGENLFCLVILDTEKAKTWLKLATDAVADEAARDAALFKTEALKNQARERLNELVEKEKTKLQQSYKKVMNAGS